MNSIKLTTTACTPSRFRMPTSGHAFGAVTAAGSDAAAVKAGLRYSQTSIPATSAWSPPTC